MLLCVRVTHRIFLLFSLLFLLLTSREPPWADAHVTYDTTQRLVDDQVLDVKLTAGPPWFYAIREGRRYGVFPLGNVIAMIPSYLTFKLVHKLPKIPERPIFALASHVSPTLLMAGACTLLYVLLRRRRTSPGWALGGTFIGGFATMMFVYARAPYSEALQTLALLWLVERTLAQAESPTVGGLGWLGLAAGILCNAKLVYVLILPICIGYLLWQQRGQIRSLLLRSLVGVAAFVELMMVAVWHNRLKTGSYFDSGYQIKEGIFSGDLVAGVYGFFLSSGKSVFLYAPVVILGVLGAATAFRRRRAETVFLVSLSAMVVLFNAKFRHWHADYCWGPRHLVALMPISILLMFPWLPEALQRGRQRIRRWAVGFLVAGGIAVQLLGSSFYWDHYIRALIAVKDQTGAPGWFQENLTHGHYIPSFSPIAGQWWMLKHYVTQTPDLARDAPWRNERIAPADLTEAWNRLRIDWWGLDWIDIEGKPDPYFLSLLVLLVGGSILSGIGLRAALRRARAISALETPAAEALSPPAT